jgi:hypothetical protein
VAHFGLGAFFGAFPCKYGVGLLGLLVVKELVADILRNRWAALSIVDSVADIACIAAGLLFTRWAMRRTLASGARFVQFPTYKKAFPYEGKPGGVGLR